MEPNLVLRTCAVLLALAASGGVTMAVMRFGGKPNPPAWLAMLHGFMAAAALTLLLYASATVGLSVVANAALVLFLVAAAGGAYLNLEFHSKLLPLPKWLVLVHGTIAVAGYLLLLAATFSSHT
ncbi:MAG TPA: hypothetical protein VFI49_02840 [Rudaea sp.]|nr:hypothetical protein [Rudaea sp.]